jgi:hypothetical protein
VAPALQGRWKVEHVVTHAHWQPVRGGRMSSAGRSLKLPVILATRYFCRGRTIAIGRVSVPIARVIVLALAAFACVVPIASGATVPVPHYYGYAQAVFPNDVYGGYVRLWSGALSLSNYSYPYIADDDFWVQDMSSGNFIESGIIVGSFCGSGSGTNCTRIGPYKVPRYFWGDQRAGGGYNAHVDVNSADYPPSPGAVSVLNTYHNDYIQDEGNGLWYVQSGPWSGDSTSNPLIANELTTGTEITQDQTTATACNGQSGIGYYATLNDSETNNLTSDWPNAGPYGDNPPEVNWVAAGEWHDWTPKDENTQSNCAY